MKHLTCCTLSCCTIHTRAFTFYAMATLLRQSAHHQTLRWKRAVPVSRGKTDKFRKGFRKSRSGAKKKWLLQGILCKETKISFELHLVSCCCTRWIYRWISKDLVEKVAGIEKYAAKKHTEVARCFSIYLWVSEILSPGGIAGHLSAKLPSPRKKIESGN